MPKVMLINVTHSEESRVAIVHEGLLVSFEIESQSRAYLKGNIYKGVIHRIHPALEAAFVDIGADRDAFLPLDEICFQNLPSPPSSPTRNEDDGGRRKLRIREVLRPGQEVLVQIVKEQFANKPPTVTTFYSLPGRYLVLLPGTDDTGISRRIEGDDRTRLRKLVDELTLPAGVGLIVRTVAGLEDAGRELKLDLEYLERLWGNIQHDALSKPARSLVYREHDIVLRTIRDFYTPDIDDIYIDDEEVYERARDFLDTVMPSARASLHLYQGEQPIFSAFNLETQIETVFKRRVPLRSGGSIVIDTTEALTAIDVNSGGSVRGANPEETAFRTNREAAREVARQLRLRDIGGLIVVDFIDMREGKHIQEIETEMREEMHVDKARHEVGRISGFGLMQISRQRLRPAATTTTYTSCPMCEGHGSVRTTESAALSGLRKIHNRISLGDVESMRVALPINVATYLLNQKRDELARLESRYQCNVDVQLRGDMMPHQIELEVRERSAEVHPPTLAPPVRAPISAATSATATSATNTTTSAAAAPAASKPAAAPGDRAAAPAPAHTPAAPNGAPGSGKRKRRRRGRRRGGREGLPLGPGEVAANGHDATAHGDTKQEAGAPPVAVTSMPSVPASAEHGAPPATAGASASAAAAPTEEGAQRSGNRRRRGRGRRGSSAAQTAAPVASVAAAGAAAPPRNPAAPPAEHSAAPEQAQPRSEPARAAAPEVVKEAAAPTAQAAERAESGSRGAAEATAPAKKRAPARKKKSDDAAAPAKPAARTRKAATAAKKTTKTARPRATKKAVARRQQPAADD